MTVESVKEEAAGTVGSPWLEAEKKYIGIPDRLAALSFVLKEVEEKLKEAGGGFVYNQFEYNTSWADPDGFSVALKLYFQINPLLEYASQSKEQPRGIA